MRLLLLATAFFARLVAPSSSLDFLPPGFLSASDRAIFSSSVADLRLFALAPVSSYSRHGGSHRAADRPMGGILVLPPEQRRVSVVEGFRRHLDAASILGFPLDQRLRASSLPSDATRAIAVAVQLGGRLAAARRETIRSITEVSARLRPLSVRIATLMPPSVHRISSRVNVAFMAALIDALGWLDTSLPERFVHGFQIVGTIPDSGVYRPVEPPGTFEDHLARLSFFNTTAHAWSRRLHRDLEYRQWALSPDAHEADLAVSIQTRKELSKGVVVGPYDSPEALHDAVASLFPHLPRLATVPRPARRFGVRQKGKIRAIDDGKGNGANAATRLLETVTTPGFIYPAVVARAVAVAASSLSPPIPIPPMVLALCDLAMAYRTIPVCQPWLTAFGFFDPNVVPPRPQYYWLPGHNFGLASAVVNFNRFPELVVVSARALAAVPAEHYYDDFIIPDLEAGGRSGLDVIEALVLQLGAGFKRPPGTLIRAPELDPEKTAEPASANSLLGVIGDLSDVSSPAAAVHFHVNESRVELVLGEFEEAFRAGILTPHAASRLRGKLYFALSAALASVGRAATLPLVQRQYRDESHAFLPGSELHHSFLFFKALLPSLPRLSIPLFPPAEPPLIIYTDASFSRRRRPAATLSQCSDSADHSRLRGALGAVVFDPIDGAVRFASAEPNWALLLSSWESERKTYIAELETLAAVSVYNTYSDLVQGRKVLHFIDNTVALSSLVHGYSGKPSLAKMVNIFYLQMIGLRASVFFDYVPSKANIADLPSRREYAKLLLELRGLTIHGASPDRLLVPSVAEWSADLSSWTRRSSLRPSTHLPV